MMCSVYRRNGFLIVEPQKTMKLCNQYGGAPSKNAWHPSL
ncbi:hypothetical protein A11S_1170 [Micavibrio aeruginosavorus EPB]|uniref:Uncharacterized protein n=1 Tax=Micavibrio aeruginosavorus EPB TaxID=349215 RepID=M4VXU3_9BACT|nr:hypothetical protein A11S_1170 [Micavibrio aeruginosavorus EPB]